MKTKRSYEGYLLIDNRAVGEPVFESATVTCSHCQRIVILNPLRTRDRHYCPKCDRYICDQCEAIRHASGGECKPFEQIIEEAQESALRQGECHG